MSRGKTGPDPDYFGVRPFPHINHPCGDHGVSFRRSSLQFNIRPWRVSALGNPLLRLGLPRRLTVFWRGWRIAALAKRRTGIRPNGLGSNRRDGDGYDSAGRPAASRHQADSTMRPTAQTQHASSRAVATLALFLFSPLASMSSRRATSRRTPLVAWRLARGSGTWPLARSLECGC